MPVCPRAGGVGPCELVNHLVMIDFVAISGSLDNRVAEYVDHLHENFVTPCVVRDGAYLPLEQPGYSAEMRADSLATYAFPEGGYWSGQASLGVHTGGPAQVGLPQVTVP